MNSYIIDIPWDGTVSEMIHKANVRLVDEIDNLARFAHIKKVNIAARFLGRYKVKGELVLKYQIETIERA